MLKFGCSWSQVQQLQTAAASAAADQAVIVRYATELTRERDGLLQRSAELETKWITAECRNVVLRQRIADLMVRPPLAWHMQTPSQDRNGSGVKAETRAHRPQAGKSQNPKAERQTVKRELAESNCPTQLLQ